jgi:hypothetical protein
MVIAWPLGDLVVLGEVVPVLLGYGGSAGLRNLIVLVHCRLSPAVCRCWARYRYRYLALQARPVCLFELVCLPVERRNRGR